MKKKGLVFLGILLLMVMVISFGGCGAPQTEEPAAPTEPAPAEELEVYELTFAGLMPPASPFEQEIMPIFLEEIEKATNGRVKITTYPGGTLIAGGDIFDGVARGTADMGHESLSWVEGRLPVSDMFKKSGVPFESSEAASRAFAETIAIIDPEEYHDVKVLMLFCTGPGDIHSTVPIRSLEDIQGLEIRCIGADSPAVTALGASPITMSHADAYEALERGVVKGTLAVGEVLTAWHMAEVTDYTTLTPFLYNGLQGIIMNLDVWNSLPKDIQDGIEEASQKVWEEHVIGFFGRQSIAGLEYAVKETGQEVITLSDEEAQRWIERVAHFIDDYVDELNQRGLPGTETKELLFELGEKYNEMYR